jgi:hypothetical protein
VQIGGEQLVDLRVVEPRPGLAVDLGGAGLEQEHMSPVLERRHLLVERPPVIGDDDDPTPGREFPRDAAMGKRTKTPTRLSPVAR